MLLAQAYHQLWERGAGRYGRPTLRRDQTEPARCSGCGIAFYSSGTRSDDAPTPATFSRKPERGSGAPATLTAQPDATHPASCGFLWNMTSPGTPASSRRSPSAAQSAGRYRARPASACPAGAAKVTVTATWHKAMPPRVPLYWRAAPRAVSGGLRVRGLVHDQDHVALILARGQVRGRPAEHGATRAIRSSSKPACAPWPTAAPAAVV